MEDFLKPFLETGFSLGKLPITENINTDSNIRTLQKVIFKHDVLPQFKELLNLTFSTEPFTVKSDVIRKLMNSLSALLLSDKDVSIKTDIFCCVFQSFITSCRGPENIQVIQFFIVLNHLLGLNNLPDVNKKDDQEGCGNLINVENFQNAFQVDASTYSVDSLQIFKGLLQCLSKTSVNLNSPEVLPYNKWLQQLLKNLVKSQPFQNIFMEILLISVDVDLKLLEGSLENIFCSILSQRCPVNKNFCDSYKTFLKDSLNIFSKFQRIVKFITKFISSVKETPTELTKETVLPLNFSAEFSKAVAGTSNQQSLSLFEILVQNVSECFTTISESSSASKMLLLSVTSELLICFLKEVKLFAPSIAATTLQTFIDKLNSLKETLQKFGNHLFSSKSFILKNKETVEVFLKLCFYCGEIQILIDCYKDSILQKSDTVPSDADCDRQCCLSSEQWDKLVGFILKSKLDTCGSVCFQLAVQKLKKVELEKGISAVDDSSLKILIHQLSLSLESFNIIEQVSPEDFNIIIQHLTFSQTQSVAKNILEQTLENKKKAESAVWLSNSTLQENSTFILSLFSVLLSETGSFLPEKIRPKFSWLLDEYLDDENQIRPNGSGILPEKINALLKNVKKTRKMCNSDERERLRNLVETFALLPIPQMKSDIRRLGLGFVVGVGTLLTDDEESVRLAFESVCGFLASDVDASECFDIGLCIKWLSELSYESPQTNDLKVKVIESLVRNSPHMKFGLSQVGEMIDSGSPRHGSPLKKLEARVVLYNELGKCWQRAKKRKSDNDLIGSFRTKLAKKITEEAKEVEEEEINEENRRIFLKIFAIELNKALKSDDEKEVESLMERKFPSFFDFAVKNLKKDFDEPSAAFLTVVLQSVPQLRKFLPQDALLRIWKSFKSHEKVNWRLFCTNSNEREFDDILTDLLNISKKFLTSDSNKHRSNCFEIWASFFEFSTETKRNSCQLRLQELFGYIHECHLLLRVLRTKKKISLIKFFSFCARNKQVVVTSHVLDTIIHVILECAEETPSVRDFHDLFTAEVEVASAVLLRQFAWSKSKVHLSFVVFNRMLRSLMTRCNAAGPEVNKEDVIMLSTCGFCLEKWVSLTVKKEKDFARTSAYFITALISAMASTTVLPPVKIHLVNCINHFLSISDSHTVAYLMRILKPGYQQVFSTAYDQFKKYHKYSGKI